MIKPQAMQRMRLHVLRDDIPEAAIALADSGVFGPEFVTDPDQLLTESPAENYRELYNRAWSRLKKIGRAAGCTLPQVGDELTHAVSLEKVIEIDQRMGELWQRFSEQEERLRILTERRRSVTELQESLIRFARLDLDLGILHADMAFLSLHLGTVPHENLQRLEQALHLAGHFVQAFHSGADADYLLIAGPANSDHDIGELLRASGFRSVKLPGEFQDHPDKIRERLDAEASELDRRIGSEQEAAQALGEQHRTELDETCRLLRMAGPYAQLVNLVKSQGAIAVAEGWIPRAQVPHLEQLLSDRLGRLFVLNVRDPALDERRDVPSVLHYPPLLRPFVGLVRNYGIPRYGEFDPTLLFALTFIAMFGMMFGDVGHGAVIAVAGLFAWPKSGRVAAFMGMAGLSSMLFGLLYGSIFGYEHILHPLWMAPLSDPLLMLQLALYWGIGFILVATILTILNLLNEGNLEAALFDTQGVAGLLFYAGGIYAGHQLMGDGSFGPVEGLAMLIPFLVILAYKWRENKSPLGEKILVVAVEGFESIISYVSNTLSFLRVAAFSLNHVALAIAVFTLADMLGPTGHWISVVLGNVFIIVVEGFIVTIQVLRLEYYEGFSRFFRGDGRIFKPLGYGA